MRKILLYITCIATLSTIVSSCDLDTEPTDNVSNVTIFKDASAAETAINGIYRACFISSWSDSWTAENFGITSINLLTDLMGDDHLMAAQGSGWFYEDYRLNVYQDYTNKSGRPYAIWKFYYTVIANANYIIGSESTMAGDPDLKKSIVGQAYAMRAYSYFYLAQLYQQTYIGNEDKAGVPIYTEPTTSKTVGKPRGTLAQTYDQINSDIDKAIQLLDESAIGQKDRSNVDYYVANGIKARIALVQQRYADARDAAVIALSKPGASILPTSSTVGFNTATVANSLWGFTIPADQSTQYNSFFSHMDADGGLYGSRAPQCISAWLYNEIPSTDDRKGWWNGVVEKPETGTSNQSYCQVKFKFKDVTTRTGDYIVMRYEEMLLIKAEAECQLGSFTEARKTLAILGQNRDSGYATRLAKFSDAKTYNTETTGSLVTLMDEILFQRRVELWGENGRILDLQRLKLGYNRNYSGSNHTQKLTAAKTSAASDWFVMLLPQAEFDGNEALTKDDQNPMPK